ncbi:hypothetical protein Cgig2_000846 [Carnegiea gigantea]|uniref:Uncharacterized protein n=1 Tax=Carnegiea gigantea TaxID=171969 RepID=A0A9Q1JMA1_9CARY|nr:hypothetical protein Cgig2_000846 [Carnegiea gigantea]
MQMSYNQMNMNMKMNVIPVSLNVTHSVPVCSVPFPKPRKIKSGVRSLNQGRPWPLKKQRGKCICRAELSLSQDAPFAIAIGACMLNSLLFPYVKDEQEQEDEENAAIGPTDARFAVMTIISFIPYFNWLCVMAELYRSKGIYAPPTGPSKISKSMSTATNSQFLQRALRKVRRIPGNRSCYLGARVTFVSFVPVSVPMYLKALIHGDFAMATELSSLFLFWTNLSLSPEESWLPIASIVLCIIHIQLEASIRNGDIDGFAFVNEVAKRLGLMSGSKDDHYRRQRMHEGRRHTNINLPSEKAQPRDEIRKWRVPRKPSQDVERDDVDDKMEH